MFFMRVALFMLVLFVSQAASAACSDELTLVSVRSVIEPTEYVRNISVQDLTDIHGNLAQKEQRVLGLGGGRIGIEAKLQFGVTTRRGKACVSLQKIKAVFSAYPEMHIASNFRRGGCEYSAVFAHEQKHIRTLKKFHREYYPELRKELKKLARQIKVMGPMAPEEVGKVQKRVSARVSSLISSFTDEVTQVHEERQNKIDTQEEYERVADQCRKWERDLNE
ncbi:MAG: hypothetical protein DHS20C02_17280 [Micavibrio sp.]|nr:MAG: hypothetical protein DHS20C02_17280 [Micavibrio sp.]